MSADTTVVNDVNALVLRPVAPRDTDSWVDVIAPVIRLAEHIATTDFVPRGLRNNVPATTAAMLYGREVGLPPMTALSSIAMIEGRPSMSAEAMRALVFAAGHEILIDKATGAECVMRGRRRGSTDWSAPVVWSIDMARAAALTHKDNWKHYPRSMLVARATTELCRNLFPDVILGFRSAEELEDVGADQQAEAPERTTTKVARKRVARKPPEPEPAAVESPPVDPPSAAAPPVPPEPAEPPEPPLPAEILPVAPPLEKPHREAALVVEDLPADEPQPARARDDDPLPDQSAIDAEDEAEALPGRVSRENVVSIVLHFDRMGLQEKEDRAERLMLTGRIIGREIGSTSELTPDEAEYVIATLRVVKSLADLRRILDVVDENSAPAAGGESGD